MINKFVFQNVNINDINFINNKNDIKFEFIDSLANSGKYCGELLCINVLSLKMNTDLEEDERDFPQFICDVSIEDCPENNKHSLVKFQGGTYDISLICKDAKVVKGTGIVSV